MVFQRKIFADLKLNFEFHRRQVLPTLFYLLLILCTQELRFYDRKNLIAKQLFPLLFQLKSQKVDWNEEYDKRQ